jgi:hypothetical protein
VIVRNRPTPVRDQAYLNPTQAEDPEGLRQALRDLVPWLAKVGELLGRTWPLARREKFGASSNLGERLYRRCREESNLTPGDDGILAPRRGDLYRYSLPNR